MAGEKVERGMREWGGWKGERVKGRELEKGTGDKERGREVSKREKERREVEGRGRVRWERWVR